MRLHDNLVRTALFVGLILCSPLHAADGPAMREACMSDFKKYCAGLMPGSERLMTCLQRNAGNLSMACRAGIEAMGGFDGGMVACAKDKDALCPSVRGPELAACFRTNEAQLSTDCRAFLVQRQAKDN